MANNDLHGEPGNTTSYRRRPQRSDGLYEVPAGTLPCPGAAAVWQRTAARTRHPAVLGVLAGVNKQAGFVCLWLVFVSEWSEEELRVLNASTGFQKRSISF